MFIFNESYDDENDLPIIWAQFGISVGQNKYTKFNIENTMKVFVRLVNMARGVMST